MAVMATVLTEFADKENQRTYTVSSNATVGANAAHSVSKPRLVIQKRKVPVGNQRVAEVTLALVMATVNSDGTILAEKILMETKVRLPIDGVSTDVDNAETLYRDFVNSDEFSTAIRTQNWVA